MQSWGELSRVRCTLKVLHSFLLILCFAVQPTNTSANQADVPGQLCGAMSELAGNIMKMRQNGVPMVTAMEISDKADPSIKDFVAALILAAYEQPRFSVEENRQNAALDFQNMVALQCYKSAKK